MSEILFRITTTLLALVLGGAKTESFAPSWLRGQSDPASFEGLSWVDRPPPDLKGKVVVVRWWTNGCALCSGSSEALQALAKKAPLVSVYHPKPPRDVTPEQVKAWAKAAGIPGVLAVDRDWAVLKRWTAGKKRDFTSLTFVLDGRGRIREVHGGGRLTEKDAGELGRRIEALRAEDK